MNRVIHIFDKYNTSHVASFVCSERTADRVGFILNRHGIPWIASVYKEV